MTINEFQRECLRTARTDLPSDKLLLNGILGIGGEAGECVDYLKKHLFQGHELDPETMISELGDLSWYIAVTAYSLGYDLEQVFIKNKTKLRARYPDGFKADLSIHRKEGDI